MLTLSTPERLALLKLAQATAPMQPSSTLSPIEPVDRSRPLPLSLAQQRLWLIEQLSGVEAARHLHTSLTLKGTLDQPALARALDRIVVRHEALRTTFYLAEGQPAQRIATVEESRFDLRVHDLTGHPASDGELARLVAEERRARFDLERGPLVRGQLIRRGPEDHLLLISMHHIVSDGWSLELFTSELRALYGAFLRGAADPLPELPVQYADYAAWQRRALSGDRLRQQASYWTETLSGAPEQVALPADRPRPARPLQDGAIVHVLFDEALTRGLKAIALRHGVTLFMTILAAWAAVLGRLSGQEDVVIGTPAAGRGRQEIEGLIGFFVNSLPIRIALADTLTVQELLARVKARVVEAQQHQDIPFDQVVELMQPARSISRHPLFQVMFAWQNAPRTPGKTRPAGLADRLTDDAVAPVQEDLDLSLWLMEADGRIAGSLTYATALFERATAERHVEYLRQALTAMVADDQQRVARLPLLPERERLQLIESWNRTDLDLPRDLCLPDLFEAQAARTPDAVAVQAHDAALTYAELNARANRLGHHLRELGVGPEARVAICGDRSPEAIIAILAVLKAGGAFVPLDPAAPVERLRSRLRDSTPAVVLIQADADAAASCVADVAADAATAIATDVATDIAADVAGDIAGVVAGDVPVLRLTEDAAWAHQPATNPPRASLRPEHLAYVAYTSGSTGAPKGVMVEHRSVCNHTLAVERAFALTPNDCVLQFAPLAFDIAIEEIVGALTSGATLVLRDDDWLVGAGAFLARCARHRVTVMDLPTRFWQLLLDERVAMPSSVRLLVIGGEAVERDALTAWFGRAGHRPRLFIASGPTETTIDSTMQEALDADSASRTLGRPMANARAYVLDASMEPEPAGVTGELYIGGVQVTRGYLGRPALTAERFVPDPFGAAGDRLYRTGDLGRWRGEGTIQFAGRADFQVKVRGFRVELGEIEARLREHPDVRDALVLALDEADGSKRLVAYIVGGDGDGGGARPEELRAHLDGLLPEYMVPAAYVRLDALPLTSTGKVDRRALPAPGDESYARRRYEPPLGEIEEALARIWSEVLGIEGVGRTDNFFELGGHSLLAVRMFTRVREELLLEVPTGGVFAWPRLADFARELTLPSLPDLPAIQTAARDARLPLSFPQSRLWSLEQRAGAGGAGRVSMRMRMTGGLDRASLIAALDALVARHETLRTTIVDRDGLPEQRIAPADSRFTLVEDDVRGAAEVPAALRALLIDEVRAPFDLTRGPLVRGRLIRIDEDGSVLAVTMHPMIADGWSIGIFARELTALYGAFHRGESDPLPPLAPQYADYAVWQRRLVTGDALKAQAAYWMQTLGDAPERLALPTDHPRPAQQDYAGARVIVELDATLTQALRALARRHRVTVYMVLLAGWGIVLHRLAGQDDVVIGSPTANRRRREIQGIIGAFENTLALRLTLSGHPTVGDLLAQVKARTLEAHQHQDLPFEAVADLVRPARALSDTPLFQAMFLWRNAPPPDVAMPGLAVAPVTALEPRPLPESTSPTTARFDLTLALHERGERIVGSLTYATALFERNTMERHAEYLRHVLEAMAANDEVPVISGRDLTDAVSLNTEITEDTREIATARTGADDQPLTIRASGTRTPLFLVHDAAGATAAAQVLASYVGDDVPLYVLPAPTSVAAPARTVEEMATQLVRMLHACRPVGPYRVAGWAFGGVLAHEIATQLLGEDEMVEDVGMFDGDCPGQHPGERPGGLAAFGDAWRDYIPQPLPIPVHRLLSDAIARPRPIARPPRPAGDSFILKLHGGKRGVAPLLCVPGAGTSVTSYIDVISVLDPSWPVHGLQPRGLDGLAIPHATVAAAAQHYLRAIEEMWPDGPIHLLGHSFGGWIAFEMALRLRASGRAIGSLTIVDSEVPETDARSYDVDSALAFLKLVEVVELSAERSFGIARADIEAMDERARLKLLHRKMVQYGLLNARATDEQVLYGPSRVFARCIRTVYRPSGRYPDRVRLLLANDPKQSEAANRDQRTQVVRGWRRWAPGLVVSTSTGNHVTALKPPHVATLGHALAEDRVAVTIER